MTSFIESPRFPDDISYGAVAKRPWSKSDIVVASGWAQRTLLQASPLANYDVTHAIRNATQHAQLLAFWRAIGPGYQFRFKDWADFQFDISNGVLGAGVGTGLPMYQLGKLYAAGSISVTRPLKKPVAGTLGFYRNGVALVVGAGAGQIAIDTAAGIVTFVADASTAASSITVGSTTQVVLASNPGTLVAGKKLYLSGFTGADAALVNGLAHTVGSVSGSGPYTFTLSTNTAGKTITLGAGQGAKYPQASDTLTAAGEFDVPCWFRDDALSDEQVTRSGGGLLSAWKSILIDEVRL